jgi:hypothetical protein
MHTARWQPYVEAIKPSKEPKSLGDSDYPWEDEDLTGGGGGVQALSYRLSFVLFVCNESTYD